VISSLLAGLVCLALVAGFLWWLGREVARLQRRLDRRTDARIDTQLQTIWQQVGRLHGEHAWHVDASIRRTDETAHRVANGQGQLDARLEVVESWIRHWSRQVEP
jgi:hypothetical protein